MLVAGHNSLKDAGLGSKEPLTDFTDTIYSMVSELYPLSETTYLNLAEVIAAYVTLRREGQSQEDAKEGLTELYKALLGL